MATYTIPPLGPGWQLAALIARYRFALSLEREVIGILEDAYRQIAEDIRRGPPLSRTERRAIEDRFLEIRKLLAEAYGTAHGRVSPVLRDYAALEAELSARQAEAMRAVTAAMRATSTTELATTIGGAAGGVSAVIQGVPRQLVVSSARLAEIVEQIDVGGIGFGAWWDRARDDGILRVRRMIQTGIVRGLNPTQIASTIWSQRNLGGPNAWRQSRTVLSTAVRTVVTAVQSEAALTAEQSFRDVIGWYEFQAVIDSRTSDICRPLDGTRYRPGDPKMPVPPLHPHCRSALVPIPDIPGIDSTGSPRTTYDAWLRQQSPATQNAILGNGIAEHYRAGKTTLSDLLSVDRRPLSLAQLRRALHSADPASYAAWIGSLPDAAQNAVLGKALATRFRSGAAPLADLLAASARAGVVTTTD
jgi:SPP1 gp7 family putative phage head morphogenesis protein